MLNEIKAHDPVCGMEIKDIFKAEELITMEKTITFVQPCAKFNSNMNLKNILKKMMGLRIRIIILN